MAVDDAATRGLRIGDRLPHGAHPRGRHVARLQELLPRVGGTRGHDLLEHRDLAVVILLALVFLYLPRIAARPGVGAVWTNPCKFLALCGGAFLIGVLTGRLDREKILMSLLQATRTAAAVFTVLIGALIFGYFLTVTQTPQKVTAFMTGLGLGRYGVLALIMLMYIVLGCLMDSLAMIILTIPIIFPVITQLGFDPIWFGVIIVMTVELGLIHPPVGMNVFVIKSVVQDVSFSTIFKGVLPFIVTDLIRLVILIAFPILALWLPSHM